MAGPKGAADAKAGKEASAKGAEKTASEKAASPAKGEKTVDASAKSEKIGSKYYIFSLEVDLDVNIIVGILPPKLRTLSAHQTRGRILLYCFSDACIVTY